MVATEASVFGGAIYNQANLVLSNCAFTANLASGGLGGLGGEDGTNFFPGGYTLFGIARGGTGSPGSGGAIYNESNAVATILDSTFASNLVVGGATMKSADNVNTNNGAAGPDSQGGAVYNAGTNTMLNCTLSANTVTGGAGGAGGNANTSPGNGGAGGNAYGGNIYNSGLVAVTNCTIADGQVVRWNRRDCWLRRFAPSAATNGPAGSGYGANIANVGGRIQF